MLWVCFSSASTRELKNKQNKAKHKQNPTGKPVSDCFPTDTGRQIHISAGQ
jgi:hypothetical protein